MNRPRQTVEAIQQLIAEQLKRQEESRAAVADLRARARLLDRKLDTRRKIIAGAGLLASIKMDSAFREQARKALAAAITRPQDRALLHEFFPEAPSPPAPPSRPVKAPGEPPTGTAPA